MSVLGDSWHEINKGLAACQVGAMEREAMHVAFMLGARTVLEAMDAAGKLPAETRLAMLDRCCAEWRAFQDEIRAMLARASGDGGSI